MRALLLALACTLWLPTAAVAQKKAETAPKPAKLDSKAKKALGEQLKTLFAKEDDAGAVAAVLAELKKHPPLTERDAKTFAKMALRYGFTTPKAFRIPRGAKFDFPFEGKTAEVHASGSGRRGKGLWIGLHGGGPGVGDGSSAMGSWRTGASVGVGLYPDVERTTKMAWNDAHAHRYVQQLLRAAIRTWQIDTNRVYVSGHSMGGYGTWSHGCINADRWAALVSGAGGGYGNGVPINLYNTPIWFYHSTDDPRVPAGSDQANARELAALKKKHPNGYTYVYKEYDDRGHGFPPDGLTPPIKWASKFKRDPYPKKVIWHASQEYDADKTQFFWFYAPSKPSRYGPLIGEFVDESTLELRARYGVGGLTILLSPELVDFDKPLTIKVNGKVVHEGFPQYDPWAIALSLLRLDAKQYFMGHVVLPGELPEERSVEDDEMADEDDDDSMTD